MIKVRRDTDRGQTKLDWLDSRHTFSFGQYHDLDYTSFSSLRVINEDRVSEGAGFATHSHQDMEIITYVLEGELVHKDSTGASSTIRVGEVQLMSAGTGISHSEHNGSDRAAVHFLQIWIFPNKVGLAPSYQQQVLPFATDRNQVLLIASKDGRDGSLLVHQDVDIWAARLASVEQTTFHLETGRRAWGQIARGSVILNGVHLHAGDGAAVTEEQVLEITALENVELLVFDLA